MRDDAARRRAGAEWDSMDDPSDEPSWVPERPVLEPIRRPHEDSAAVAEEARPTERFVLRRTSPRDWVIHDRSRRLEDPGRVVARISETNGDYVDVDWAGDVALLEHYFTAEYALDDLVWWARTAHRERRPVPIAHFPPPHIRGAG